MWSQFPGSVVRLNSLSGLAAIEEAGGEEDDGDYQGQTGVLQVMQAEAYKSVCKPCCKAYEPDPCCLSHHPHAPEKLSQIEQAQFDGLVLH